MSTAAKRLVALDLETTGLAPGNRAIEVGAVEIIDRQLTGRELRQYVNPEHPIEPDAQKVHGISAEFLADKPKFAKIMPEVLAFVQDAEVLIHNAPFDLRFLDTELEVAGYDEPFRHYCQKVTDTLEIAKKLRLGDSSLNALCDLYKVDRTDRTLHGALLDAQLLAHVYLKMTGGQRTLGLQARSRKVTRDTAQVTNLITLEPNDEERRLHEEFLSMLDTQAGKTCQWRQSEAVAGSKKQA